MSAVSVLRSGPGATSPISGPECDTLERRSRASILSRSRSGTLSLPQAGRTVFALAHALAFASVLCTVNAHATSFDCAKARSFSEHAACDEPDLAALDDTLANAYARAYKMAPDQRAIAADRDAQWRWRQIHCIDNACVLSWYQRRIEELEADYVASQSHPYEHERNAPPLAQNVAHFGADKANTEKLDRKSHGLPSLASDDETAAAIARMAKGKVQKRAPNGPLPSDAEMAHIGAADIDSVSVMPVVQEVGLSPSSHLMEQNWPGLPPLLQTGSTNFGIVSNRDRPTRRTIGIQMGF